jgi:hypothetical protein
MPRASAVVALAVLLLATGSAGAAKPAPIAFRAFADTGRLLVDVLWTGRQFLYVENTTNAIFAAEPAGTPVTPFADLPDEVEETRCRVSQGAHGFRAGIYCHAPGNAIYRIGLGGSPVELFAQLPDTATSDGALAFDTVGRFGYSLIAATGRSGGATPAGGTVYAIAPSGAVRTIGAYDGPGGADELAVAPAKFGTGSGQVVLTVDAGPTVGTLVMMNPQGRTRTIARLPDGPNPIATVTASKRGASPVPRGLYVTDTFSHTVFLAPAAQLAPYVGSLVVGTESKATFWIVQPNGRGFRTFKVPATFPITSFNLEGATYVSG